jgi:hypothetical protein
MYYDLAVVIKATLLVIGIYWCYKVFGRWRSDLEDLRKVDDTLEKAVIIGIWALTIVIAILVINFAVGFIGNIVSAIRELL